MRCARSWNPPPRIARRRKFICGPYGQDVRYGVWVETKEIEWNADVRVQTFRLMLMGLPPPAPRRSASAGAFDIKSGVNKESGPFDLQVRFQGRTRTARRKRRSRLINTRPKRATPSALALEYVCRR